MALDVRALRLLLALAAVLVDDRLERAEHLLEQRLRDVQQLHLGGRRHRRRARRVVEEGALAKVVVYVELHHL